MLTLAEDPDLVAELGCGDSFGELSLIYNTFREATFKAMEDSEVYVISRRHFKAHFNRKGHHFKENGCPDRMGLGDAHFLALRQSDMANGQFPHL
eukprot:s2240_g2.t1